jgi:curved DNA-binding protein CbpA
MSNQAEEFSDLYELLQVSPNAQQDTIQRVFRLLAQRYHPDNHETGNEPMFQQLLKGYQTLSDPVTRAAYDAKHRSEVKKNWEVFDKTAEPQGRDAERRKREGILAVLYRKRQFTPEAAGMNIRELEGVMGIPREHLEFSLWYLKESGDIKPGDNGRFFISVKGVDRYEGYSEDTPIAREPELHLLPEAKRAS